MLGRHVHAASFEGDCFFTMWPDHFAVTDGTVRFFMHRYAVRTLFIYQNNISYIIFYSNSKKIAQADFFVKRGPCFFASFIPAHAQYEQKPLKYSVMSQTSFPLFEPDNAHL